MPDAAGRCTVGGLSPWNGGILVSCRNIVNLSASRSYIFSPFQTHRAVLPRPNRHHSGPYGEHRRRVPLFDWSQLARLPSSPVLSPVGVCREGETRFS